MICLCNKDDQRFIALVKDGDALMRGNILRDNTRAGKQSIHPYVPPDGDAPSYEAQRPLNRVQIPRALAKDSREVLQFCVDISTELNQTADATSHSLKHCL